MNFGFVWRKFSCLLLGDVCVVNCQFDQAVNTLLKLGAVCAGTSTYHYFECHMFREVEELAELERTFFKKNTLLGRYLGSDNMN